VSVDESEGWLSRRRRRRRSGKREALILASGEKRAAGFENVEEVDLVAPE